MSLWTASEAMAATGGQCTVPWDANGVSIDTRTLQAGDLFVALSAQRDGHEFVLQALKDGAAAALVAHRPAGVGDDAPLLIVPNVLEALIDLGRAARTRTQAKVIAVTGSVGKTSTKEMLKTVLESQGRTHASVASYNNHWGVPLSLARMPVDSQYAIFEIGMNHPGEIAPLSQMVQPHVAMITTIAPAHMEAFESIEGIAQEKSDIITGLVPGGTVILPADVGTIDILVQPALARGVTIVGFGEIADAFRLTALEIHGDVTVVKARVRGNPMALRLNTVGRHFAINAMGVLAAVEAMAGDPGRAAVDLFRWQPLAGRGLRETIILDVANAQAYIELIDDSYNANPTSVAAALDVLVSVVSPKGNQDGRCRRTIIILGDMLELGADEIQLHVALAQNPHLLMADVVHCIGPRMHACYEKLPLEIRGCWAETAAEFALELDKLVAAGDTILVKGSLGSRVSMIVDLIRNLGQRSKSQA